MKIHLHTFGCAYWGNRTPPSPLKRPWALQVSVQHLIDPNLPGLDPAAGEKLVRENRRQVRELLDIITDIARQNEQKFAEIAIAINCVGGKARSVALAELTAIVLTALGYQVAVVHRDIDRPIPEKIDCVED